MQATFAQIDIFTYFEQAIFSHISIFFVFVQCKIVQNVILIFCAILTFTKCNFNVFVRYILSLNLIALLLLKYIQPHLPINPAPLLRLMYNIPLHTASKQTCALSVSLIELLFWHIKICVQCSLKGVHGHTAWAVGAVSLHFIYLRTWSYKNSVFFCDLH